MNATAESILDPVFHERLIADRENVCLTANVPWSFIEQSMKHYCDDDEVEYFVNHRVTSYAGLVIVGKDSVSNRCLALAGAFLRQKIDARVMPLNTVLDAIELKVMPEPTVLVIPNLQVNSIGKTLPAWKVAQMFDVLLQRHAAGKQTVVAVEDLDAVGTAYGAMVRDHLENNFKITR